MMMVESAPFTVGVQLDLARKADSANVMVHNLHRVINVTFAVEVDLKNI
jgi:hypothetical protein